jgi:hypothetical protein
MTATPSLIQSVAEDFLGFEVRDQDAQRLADAVAVLQRDIRILYSATMPSYLDRCITPRDAEAWLERWQEK